MKQIKQCRRFSGICLPWLTLISLVGVLGCATTTPKTRWDTAEKAMLASYVGLNVVDYGQTRWGLDHGYLEANPIIGKSPNRAKILLMKGLICGGTIYLADKWKEERKVILAFGIIWGATSVTNNYLVIGWKWRF